MQGWGGRVGAGREEQSVQRWNAGTLLLEEAFKEAVCKTVLSS